MSGRPGTQPNAQPLPTSWMKWISWPFLNGKGWWRPPAGQLRVEVSKSYSATILLASGGGAGGGAVDGGGGAFAGLPDGCACSAAAAGAGCCGGGCCGGGWCACDGCSPAWVGAAAEASAGGWLTSSRIRTLPSSEPLIQCAPSDENARQWMGPKWPPPPPRRPPSHSPGLLSDSSPPGPRTMGTGSN